MEKFIKSIIIFFFGLFSVFIALGAAVYFIYKLSRKYKKEIKIAFRYIQKFQKEYDKFTYDFEKNGLKDLERGAKRITNKISSFSDNANSYIREVVEETPLNLKNDALGARQKSILELISENKKINMRDISTKFPSVTPRTLRRDLSSMESLGLIRKNGKTKNSFYTIS